MNGNKEYGPGGGLVVRAACAVAVCVLLLGVAARVEEGAKVKPFAKARMIFKKIEGYPSCHGATITELPGGALMAAWYAGAYEKAKDVVIFASMLPKGADDWKKPFILHDTMSYSEGNPVLYTDRGGRVWFFYVTMFGDMWTDCKVYYKTSDDGGKSWNAPVTLREETGWMTRNRPLELKDGTFILPMYDEVRWQPLFMLTNDGGKTWAAAGEKLEVPGGAIQPAVIPRDDGSLLAFLRTGEPGGNVWTIESKDSGATWGSPARTELPNPNAAVDAVKLISGAVAMVFNDSPYDRTPLSVALSHDDGKTWPDKRKLEKKFGEFSYPAMIQASDGTIHIVYTYKRTQIKHAAFNEEWLMKEKK
ncbi:exo-alpha-sialidase [bacterium]